MGSPFSGDPRSNNVWRLYEWVAGHPVDEPPIETDLAEKPPVPTLALWSRRDGIVSIAARAARAAKATGRSSSTAAIWASRSAAAPIPQIVAAIRSLLG